MVDDKNKNTSISDKSRPNCNYLLTCMWLWPFCICPAFWDATRAFMLLAVLSCFAGVVLGLSAFTNGTKNRRVRTGGIALVLSGNTDLLETVHLIVKLTVLLWGRIITLQNDCCHLESSGTFLQQAHNSGWSYPELICKSCAMLRWITVAVRCTLNICWRIV